MTFVSDLPKGFDLNGEIPRLLPLVQASNQYIVISQWCSSFIYICLWNTMWLWVWIERKLVHPDIIITGPPVAVAVESHHHLIFISHEMCTTIHHPKVIMLTLVRYIDECAISNGNWYRSHHHCMTLMCPMSPSTYTSLSCPRLISSWRKSMTLQHYVMTATGSTNRLETFI